MITFTIVGTILVLVILQFRKMKAILDNMRVGNVYQPNGCPVHIVVIDLEGPLVTYILDLGQKNPIQRIVGLSEFVFHIIGLNAKLIRRTGSTH